MFACEESTSIDCAREIRGSRSSAKPVTPACASASMPAASNGSSMPTSAAPRASFDSSSPAGARTFSTSAAASASAALPIRAPAVA